MADENVFRPDMTASWRPMPLVGTGYPQQMTRPTWGAIGTPEHPTPQWDERSTAAIARKVTGLGNLGLVSGYELPPWWYVLATVSGGVSLYHGYKRNRGSLGWGLAWFLMGAWFPIVTPVVAVAQGYAKPAR